MVWIFVASFFAMLISFGQLNAGRRWWAIPFYLSCIPLGLSIGFLLVSDWTN